MIGIWNSGKYFPAWGNELILERTVNQLTTATANISISNWELVSQILEFSLESFARLQNMYGP